MTLTQLNVYSSFRTTLRGRLLRYGGFSAILLAFLLAGGCVRSIQPVLKADQLIVDNALAGKWVAADGKGSVEIQPAGEDKAYKVVYTDEHGKTARLIGHLGKLGDLMIAQFQPQEPEGEVSDVYSAHLLPLYSFIVIRQTKPQLIVTTMSADWFKKYIEAHLEELAVLKPSNDDLIVSAPTEAYQAFILRHAKDQGAFGEPQTFVRPGAATQPMPTAP